VKLRSSVSRLADHSIPGGGGVGFPQRRSNGEAAGPATLGVRNDLQEPHSGRRGTGGGRREGARDFDDASNAELYRSQESRRLELLVAGYADVARTVRTGDALYNRWRASAANRSGSPTESCRMLPEDSPRLVLAEPARIGRYGGRDP